MKKLSQIDKIFESENIEISSENIGKRVINNITKAEGTVINIDKNKNEYIVRWDGWVSKPMPYSANQITFTGEIDKEFKKETKFKVGEEAIFVPKSAMFTNLIGSDVRIKNILKNDGGEQKYSIHIGGLISQVSESELLKIEDVQNFKKGDKIKVNWNSSHLTDAYKDKGNGKGTIQDVNGNKYTILWDNDIESTVNFSEIEYINEEEQKEYEKKWRDNFSKDYNSGSIFEKGDKVYIDSGPDYKKYPKNSVKFKLIDIIYRKPPMVPVYILSLIGNENEIIVEQHGAIGKSKNQNIEMEQTEPVQQKIEKPNKFKRGDKVMFSPMITRKYQEPHKGPAEIISLYGKMENDEEGYSIKTKKGIIVAYHSELTPITEIAPPLTNQAEELEIGDRVVVNGSEEGEKVEFINRKGTVRRVSKETVLIEFDEDESKNLSSETFLVDKDFVEKESSKEKLTREKGLVQIYGTNKFREIKPGDAIIVINNYNNLKGIKGIVERIWDDESCQVDFITDSGGKLNMYVTFDDINIIQKTAHFDVEPPPETKNTIEYTEEEEDDDEDERNTQTNITPLKKEDLLEFSYKDFTTESKISTKEDLLKIKVKYEDIIKDVNIPKIKKVFAERTLKTIEIIESYFNFLTSKVANGLPVLRTVEGIDDEDLLRTKTKVRASELKELTKKYSFDQGIIAYWKFKDAVVFKTI